MPDRFCLRQFYCAAAQSSKLMPKEALFYYFFSTPRNRQEDMSDNSRIDSGYARLSKFSFLIRSSVDVTPMLFKLMLLQC